MFGRKKKSDDSVDSQQLLKSLLSHEFTAVYSVDLKCNLTSWNKAAEHRYGYSRAEIIGKSIDLLMPAQGNHDLRIIRDIVPGKPISGYQTVRRTKDGREIQVELSGAAIVDSAGKKIGMSLVSRDITQQLETIQALNETKDRITLATESAQIGIWELDLKPNTLVWDERMHKLYGLTDKDFKGTYKEWINNIHKDDRKRADQEIRGAINEQRMLDTSFRVIWPSGSIRHIRAFGKPTKNSAGEVVKLVGVNWDITNETENIKSIERFKLAVDSAYDHVIICDARGRIIYANSAAIKTTGYSINEMLGNTPSLWGGQMPKEFYKEMWKTISEKKIPFVGEVTNLRKTGEIYIAEAHISPILSDVGNEVEYYLGIERDVTQLKEVDKSKTEFVSLASHQLRTPLSAVNWYAELLLESDTGPLNPTQKGYLKEIYTGNQRMVKLVNTLLNVSRLELGTFSFSPKIINPSAILDQILKDLQITIKQSDITIKRNATKEPVRYLADKELFEMVLQNLVSNAVKYTPNGGSVTIKLETDKDYLRIKVVDTGRGIPANQQDKIFTKLFRADNVQVLGIEGTGLGLYIVKSVVDQMGGKISFTSRLNQGTAFSIDLPKKGSKLVNKSVEPTK